MKLTVSTLLLTILTATAHPLASQAEQHSSISGTPCSLVNCKSACSISPETCHALCQGDKDLPLCAIGTSPPNFSHVPNQRKDVARVQPPPKLRIPTPYCSIYTCSNICDPLWYKWAQGAPMPQWCASYCNDNIYMPMCPEGTEPVYKDA